MASDTFTGTGSLGANWTNSVNTCSRASDVARGDTDAAYNAAFWSGTAHAATQTSQAVFQGAGVLNTDYMGLGVRMSGSGGTANGYFWFGPFSGFQKCTNGTFTNITQDTGEDFFSVSAGDTVRLEISGTTLRILLNGVEQATATDSDFSSGSPGIAFFDDGERLDNWQSTGDTSVAPPVFPARLYRSRRAQKRRRAA